jgi:regulator of protease activity HflC (stomatin/prohibitin superfamily)
MKPDFGMFLRAATPQQIFIGAMIGLLAWFIVRYVIMGFYTVDQNERALVTSFGRAERLTGTTGGSLSPGERERYAYPQVRVVQPGGPYFRWPWQKVHKVSIATRTVNMAWDPQQPSANSNGTRLDAVTKDQLNVGLTGQIRYRVAESNLYAYLFGVKRPEAHVMGYFISILRERIANFEALHKADKLGTLGSGDASAAVALPSADGSTSTALMVSPADDISAIAGVSINDLRKNLRRLNEVMDRDCQSSVERYGVHLDASLITEIDSSHEVESALAAINTAHNHVSSDISLAQASADQRIVQSKRAVEIATLRAQTEVEPLRALAAQLTQLKQYDPKAVDVYLRNVRLSLYTKADRVFMETK